jgi:hypothetical protein
MKSFILNLFRFLFIFLISSFVLSALLILLNISLKDGLRKNKEIFYNKISYFENFYKREKSINLIMGSSTMEDAIIPYNLGSKWFSFTNPSQNIYSSYKILNFYNNFTKIDTIIIDLLPYDFKSDNQINKSDIIHDFNPSINTPSLKYKMNYSIFIQSYKDYYFFNLGKLFRQDKDLFQHLREIWDNQGYSARITYPGVKMDTTLVSDKYFEDVSDNPNINSFLLFHNLCLEKNIKVIYILTPKSYFYNLRVNNSNQKILVNNIMNLISKNNITLWDYEELETATNNQYFFIDPTHLSEMGAKVFTEIIKNRLYEKDTKSIY